jgi:hypothetical protein
VQVPSSAVRTFLEPSEYAAAIRATTINMTVMERGQNPVMSSRTKVNISAIHSLAACGLSF